MDTPQPDKLLKDVQYIIDELPKPIATFLTDGSIDTVAKTITQKNHLHVDQGAVVEKALIFTLMGIQEPATLPKMLREDAQLEEDTLNSILSDINTLAFAPLHESMRTFETTSSPETLQETETPAVANPIPKLTQTTSEASIGNQNNTRDIVHSTLTNFAEPRQSVPSAPLTEPPPIPLRPKNPRPIVKEYAVDPYRESTKTQG